MFERLVKVFSLASLISAPDITRNLVVKVHDRLGIKNDGNKCQKGHQTAIKPIKIIKAICS